MLAELTAAAACATFGMVAALIILFKESRHYLRRILMLESEAVSKLNAVASGLAAVKTAVDTLKAAVIDNANVPDDLATAVDGVVAALQTVSDDLAAPTTSAGAAPTV